MRHPPAESVQPELVLSEGSSWADYASGRALERTSIHPATDDEHAINLTSLKQSVAAIWGTRP